MNFRFRTADGFTIVSGATKDDGQIVASPSVVVFDEAKKMCIENIDSRKFGGSPSNGAVLRRLQIGSNDGWAYARMAADPNGTISKPWGVQLDGSGVLTGGPTAVSLGGPYGVWPGTGFYGVVVTAENAVGETIASVETVFEVMAVNEEWQFAIVQVPGATNYRWFITDVPGTYDAYSLAFESGSGAVLTFTFDGDIAGLTAGTPPDENTTGGAGPYYGTDPIDSVFSISDLPLASAPAGIAVGQQVFFYYIERLPAGATMLGNKRQFGLLPVEV